MKTQYPAWQLGLTVAVGCLIAWQGVPHDYKVNIPNLWAWEIVTSVVLGGLYALEKLLQIPTVFWGKSNQQNQEDK